MFQRPGQAIVRARPQDVRPEAHRATVRRFPPGGRGSPTPHDAHPTGIISPPGFGAKNLFCLIQKKILNCWLIFYFLFLILKVHIFKIRKKWLKIPNINIISNFF
jgi:hypothetical protein